MGMRPWQRLLGRLRSGGTPKVQLPASEPLPMLFPLAITPFPSHNNQKYLQEFPDGLAGWGSSVVTTVAPVAVMAEFHPSPQELLHGVSMAKKKEI